MFGADMFQHHDSRGGEFILCLTLLSYGGTITTWVLGGKKDGGGGTCHVYQRRGGHAVFGVVVGIMISTGRLFFR